MRIPLIPLLVLLVCCISADLRIWHAISTRTRNGVSRWLKIIHIVSSVLLYGVLIAGLALPRRSGNDEDLTVIMWIMFAFMAFYIPKILFCIIDLVSCIPVLCKKNRLKWLSKSGAVLSVFLFVGMWWGAFYGRYVTQVREVTVQIPDLPESFEGYKIAQFSDFHVGTYVDDTTFVSQVVDEINSLGADVIVFTGDIVNRHSSELQPFTKTLSRLKARDGVFAILGNHDYGDYMDWPSEEAKKADRKLLIDLFNNMNWNLLLNQTKFVNRGQDSIAVIGVENVGDPPFKVYGSLPDSYPGLLSDSLVKILLTHNPAHWTMDIENNRDINIALTLSGHTHAMQIELLGMSPAVFRYPKWGGLYKSKTTPESKYLYVNIGLGTVAIPMRLGARPEITLISLTGK